METQRTVQAHAMHALWWTVGSCRQHSPNKRLAAAAPTHRSRAGGCRRHWGCSCSKSCTGGGTGCAAQREHWAEQQSLGGGRLRGCRRAHRLEWHAGWNGCQPHAACQLTPPLQRSPGGLDPALQRQANSSTASSQHPCQHLCALKYPAHRAGLWGTNGFGGWHCKCRCRQCMRCGNRVGAGCTSLPLTLQVRTHFFDPALQLVA